MAGGWRKRHKYELAACLVLLTNNNYNEEVQEYESGGACSTIRDEKNTSLLLVRKPDGKIHLGRPRGTWVDNNKMDIVEISWDGMDWISSVQVREEWMVLVNAVMNVQVP
jgi:hypothetical protein